MAGFGHDDDRSGYVCMYTSAISPSKETSFKGLDNNLLTESLSRLDGGEWRRSETLLEKELWRSFSTLLQSTPYPNPMIKRAFS